MVRMVPVEAVPEDRRRAREGRVGVVVVVRKEERLQAVLIRSKL
jgi:hypothetical protein